MGDIDFIVPIDRFDDACKLMLENGYSQKKGDKKDTRHKSFSKGGTHYELHRHFSYTDLDIEEYITDGFEQVNQGNINGIVFPMLPKLANGLVLLAHMRNHLQSGLGLRQVIDWMMYVDKELDDLFWEQEFMRISKTVKLDKFAIAITRMCQLYLE